MDEKNQHPELELDSSARRRRASSGVLAGVVAGGAIGLFAVAPTLSSAASDDATTQATPEQTTDAPVDQRTPEETTPDGSVDDGDRPEPGEHLRELLQPLVDDGTIDAAQADAVAAHLAEQRPERGERGDHGGHRGHRLGMEGDVVAEAIGIDASELRDALREGSSIADVATANGVDPQVVVDALVAEAESHLDQAIESGRLTEAEAEEKAADLSDRITARVNGERP